MFVADLRIKAGSATYSGNYQALLVQKAPDVSVIQIFLWY
jgi:hypothetical protein